MSYPFIATRPRPRAVVEMVFYIVQEGKTSLGISQFSDIFPWMSFR
jgi:hypothetical protein